MYVPQRAISRNLASVKAGEKVLIQSASGGLRFAAINLARSLGADIWVTVGTEEKRTFLRDTYDIPGTQTFSSRTPPILETIKETTSGHYVDVILGTGSGDEFGEWLRCLAPAGRFIDVGRVDVQNHASLALEVLKSNATFSSFDLGILIEDKPTLCGRLLAQVAEMLQHGSLSPVSPVKTFDISQLAPALSYLSKGTHTGKVAVSFENQASLVNIIPPASRVRFDSVTKYVLVGGLGGLGRCIIAWMAQRGARRFVAFSRSAADHCTGTFMSTIAAQGCSVEQLRCDVSNLSDVDAAIAQASQTGVVKGIIHTAVSLEVSPAS
jgi:D-arabinose 1-dehydrogenase-like Zn-dependent alcohol dehydrogenase